jgi:V8-like Glu-specific endopeptidase
MKPKAFIVLLGVLEALSSTSALAGIIGDDDRLAIADYAKKVGMTETEARSKFAASGRVMCPFNEGSAFLVGSNDTIVTARHNIFREARMAAGNVKLGNCAFEVSLGGSSTWYEVDTRSIEFSTKEQRTIADRFDWIALKLKNPVIGVTPFKIPSSRVTANTPITIVSIRQEGFPHDDWNERVVSTCAIREVWNIDNVPASGLETDCDLTVKSSGSPLLRETSEGLEVVGIQSSGVIKPCRKFKSTKCSNWAVGFTDEIAKAAEKLAALPSARRPAQGAPGKTK